MTRVQPESRLQREIRAALAHVTGLALYRNHVGALQDGDGRWHTFGLCPGSADLIGSLYVTVQIVLPRGNSDVLAIGRFVGLETKTLAGRASREQRAWHAAMQRMGAFTAFVRSVPEAMAAIERARLGAIT